MLFCTMFFMATCTKAKGQWGSNLGCKTEGGINNLSDILIQFLKSKLIQRIHYFTF
jgi:hypothetical protein